MKFISCMILFMSLTICTVATGQKLRPLAAILITKNDTLLTDVFASSSFLDRSLLTPCCFESRIRFRGTHGTEKIKVQDLVRLEITDFAGVKRVFVNPAIGATSGALELMYSGKVSWYQQFGIIFYSYYYWSCQKAGQIVVKGAQKENVGYSREQRVRNLKKIMSDCPALFNEIENMTMSPEDMTKILTKYDSLMSK